MLVCLTAQHNKKKSVAVLEELIENNYYKNEWIGWSTLHAAVVSASEAAVTVATAATLSWEEVLSSILYIIHCRKKHNVCMEIKLYSRFFFFCISTCFIELYMYFYINRTSTEVLLFFYHDNQIVSFGL